MIKFFRKIRQNFLFGGETGKYFKYAIGEIVLVVIGILIALQVNNWNEDRKSQIKTAEIYRDLLTSLEQDSIEVERTINILTKSLETQKKLILNNSDHYTDDLSQADLDKIIQEVFSGVKSFFPKTGVYSLITTSNNMDLIQSKEIKSLLINLYDFQYKRYENVDERIDENYSTKLGVVIQKKIGYILDFNSDSKLKMIKNVDRNLFNKHYKELVLECQDMYGALSAGNNYLLEIRVTINDILQLIRDELKK